MLVLPKFLLKYIRWLFADTPKWLFTVIFRLAKFVNNTFSFTLNIRLFFVPLYGDYTLIGRFIGLVLRIFFIVFGSVFVIFLVIVSLIAPFVWYILPVGLIYYIGFWSIPIFISSYLYYVYANINVPDKKIKNLKGETSPNILLTFRPETLKNLYSLKKTTCYEINKFFELPAIKFVLQKSELLNKGLETRLCKIKDINFKSLESRAFDYASEENTRYVENEHLFLALLSAVPKIDVVLSSFELKLDTIEKTVDWIVKKREEAASAFFWQEEYDMPKMPGFGHGLTGRVTPDLDAISQDFTQMVKLHRMKRIVGQEDEIEKIANLLGSTKLNVLLIGEPGCGKTTIVKGLAQRIMHGTDYKTLQNKRIVSLEMGGLIAGARTQGEIAEKLKRAMEDVLGSGDIILFIDEIHNLVGSLHEGEGFSTVYSILEPYLSSNRIQFIGATNIENYRKFVEPNGAFARLFQIVEINEPSPEDTLAILHNKASEFETKFGVTVTTAALLQIIKLSKKMIHDRVLPDKAIDVLNRACTTASHTNKWVTTQTVEREVSEMTHIPITAVTQKESEKLLQVADEMKKRVIGQDHALDKIASALKRARVGIRDEQKPIASFLFVGTTGVGKTETAKTLSGTYFGDRKAMIRLDMSEYQTPNSIDKLIGTSDGKSKGILTEAVRTKPFSVLLLDEIEKAHHQIILTFLQVLDDARLTDSSGRTIDFTNTIIIATSNAGTRLIQKITEEGGTFEQIEEAAQKEVRNHFTPEFLNRFTSVIVFKPLSVENVKKIARILLRNVQKRTEEKSIKIEFSDELLEELVSRGFNPEWGARPLARVIEDTVETYIAEKILKNELKPGDELVLGMEVFESIS